MNPRAIKEKWPLLAVALPLATLAADHLTVNLSGKAVRVVVQSHVKPLLDGMEDRIMDRLDEGCPEPRRKRRRDRDDR